MPLDFDLPAGGLLLAWQAWCCGNERKGWAPIRLLKGVDMSSPNKKKRLSDFRFPMQMIENKVRYAVYTN